MKEALSFATYVAIGTGMALAASSFAVLSALYGVVEPQSVMIAIVAAGLLLLVVAGSIGSLASMYPSAPGMAVYLTKAYGGRISLTLMLLYLSILGCLAAVESYVFAQVLGHLLPGWFSPVTAATGVLVVVIGVNLFGFELPDRVQNLTTVLLVLLILAVGIGSLVATPGPVDPAAVKLAAKAEEGGFVAALTATGMAVFLFLGFEWVAPLGKRPQHYRRQMPVSMIVSVSILIVIYAIFAFGLAKHFPRERIAGTAIPQFILASTLSGRFGALVAALISLLAMISSFNAGLMGGARLVYALSRQGKLPPFCAKISENSGAPIGAILILGAMSVLTAIVVATFDLAIMMSSYAAAIECFMYAAVMFAWLRLGRDAKDPKIFRSPIPRFVQVLVAGLMPLLGIAALLSDEKRWLWSVGCFGIALVGLTALAHHLQTAQEKREGTTRIAN